LRRVWPAQFSSAPAVWSAIALCDTLNSQPMARPGLPRRVQTLRGECGDRERGQQNWAADWLAPRDQEDVGERVGGAPARRADRKQMRDRRAATEQHEGDPRFQHRSDRGAPACKVTATAIAVRQATQVLEALVNERNGETPFQESAGVWRSRESLK